MPVHKALTATQTCIEDVLEGEGPLSFIYVAYLDMHASFINYQEDCIMCGMYCYLMCGMLLGTRVS